MRAFIELVTTTVEATSHTAARAPDVASIYAQHRVHLWNNLFRLGVREADLPDALQEVLVVIHRRRHAFDGASKLTTWLFGICLRVAAAHRRRGFRRYESPTDLSARAEEPPDSASGECLGRMLDARARLEQVMDRMQPELRAVFVMFEIEGLDCAAIRGQLGIPLGTVHSRLHAARRVFARLVERQNERERRAECRALGGTP